MTSQARLLDLAAALKLRRGSEAANNAAPAAWDLDHLAGRLVELAGGAGSASLALACGLVLEAQRAGEPVAWITGCVATFYPPDAAGAGVDLDALAVVRVREAGAIARAADQLLRSGAFGLVVLDLPERTGVSMAMQSRLLGLAQQAGTAVLFLTRKPRGLGRRSRDAVPSLGSLVSLRGESRVRRVGVDRFACELRILKDKRGMPGWWHEEVLGGPDGLH